MNTSSSDSITFSCRNFRLCWKTGEDGLLGVSDTGVSGIVVCESSVSDVLPVSI
jgi:hypothetical protein